MRACRWLVARVAPVLGAAWFAAASGAAVSGCEVATAPPSGARPLNVLPGYATWWSEVEACSRLTGDLRRVDFYQVPPDSTDGGFSCPDGPGGRCAGEWAEPHDVYLAGPSPVYPTGYAADEWTVKHEMLHDLVGRPGHPQQFDYCHLASRSPSGVYGLGRQ
jgi:hypothetical protein